MNKLRSLKNGVLLPTFLLCLAAWLAFAPPAQAQTALTGGLSGFVTDNSGAAVAGATVRVENRALSVKQETVTDADGRFVVLGLTPTTDYAVMIEANGFRSFSRGNIGVVSGETSSIDAQLEVAEVNEAVTVTGTEAQLSDSPEVSQILDQKQLQELPLQTRSVTRIALLNPQVRTLNSLGAEAFRSTRITINGRSFRETHYKLDGSTNFDALYNNAPLQAVSLSAVQEYKVLTNQYSAEHGGTGGGFIVTTTKSGTNEFRGEAFFFVRPSGIQARPPLADRRIPNQLFNPGGAVGGPIVRDKTFFFVNYEAGRQDRGSFVDRPAPTVFLSQSRNQLALAKIDHRFSDEHTATLRVNGNYSTTTNPNDGVGFLTTSAQPAQPSAAVNYISQSVGIQGADTITRGNFVNEFRVNYVNARPFASTPLTPSVVVIRQGISTEGNGSFSTARVENYQAAEQVSLQSGNHSFRFGGDFARQKVRDSIYDQFGTYRFDTSGALVDYTQLLGTANLRYGQTRVNGFVQDDWRINPRLTLNLGLRYDYQSIIDDYNNFGPRLGFALDVRGNGKTLIRGGAGVYYDQPFLHGFTQLYLLNAPSALRGRLTLRPGDAGFPTFPNSLDPSAPFPASRHNLILRGEDIRNPYST
ncbi:MAG: TonB-dependent receptor, partial [Acidobacteriota bacterium]|nr:TonB-dependent receptor [Acidobacteriota bacterium]